jgi:hypothetical protein
MINAKISPTMAAIIMINGHFFISLPSIKIVYKNITALTVAIYVVRLIGNA